jgi:hypothetical protein
MKAKNYIILGAGYLDNNDVMQGEATSKGIPPIDIKSPK